ncbi:hypothetical protein HGRIS_002235 [Hohenbuehelia grisea]|uniref:DUF1279 domain-containing protein n=1 Tax=Hohenbuehelia grisea TaxID=104357 RepID=A0ABR3JLW6_9AGAR
MVRFPLRIPFVRALNSRLAAPLLPLAGRARPAHSALTQTVRQTPGPRLFTHFPSRLASSPPSSPQLDPRHSLPPDASLSQKLKHLIKSYGWYALGVYFLIGTIDFVVAFGGVHLIGAEHAQAIATSVKQTISGILHSKPPEPGRDEMESMNGAAHQTGSEGLYAMLVLAYTLHKTLFMPLRVGLTAALTPRIVGWLSRRGWAGAAGTRRAALEMRERVKSRRSRDSS